MVLIRRSVEAAELRKESEAFGSSGSTFKRLLLRKGALGGAWGLSKDGPAADVFSN